MTATTRMTWIRHGQVQGDHRGRLYGHLDVPLSDLGWAQARAVARELRGQSLQAIYASDLSRAQVTAGMLAADRPGLVVQIRPGLRERSRGVWARQDLEGIEAVVPEASSMWRRSAGVFTPPGGETLGQVMQRVGPELERWLDQHAGESIAIVAHLWVIRAAMAWTLGLPADRVPAIDLRVSGRVDLQWPSGARRAADGVLVSMHGTPELLPEDHQSA